MNDVDEGSGASEAPITAIKTAFKNYLGLRRGRAIAPFDRFTKRAGKALSLAREEAARFGHDYIGTEHLLLGLIAEGEGVAVVALRGLGVGPHRVRDAVEFIIGRTERTVEAEEVGLTPRAATALALAIDEARRLGHTFVGTEHVLLGLAREGEGIAAGVLESLNATLERLRAEVVRVLAGVERPDEPGASRGNVVTCRLDDRDLDAIDALVEAGVRATRSDAAAWLIHAGIGAHQPLLERVYATVAEIRRLRLQAQALAQGLTGDDSAEAPPRQPPEAPQTV